MTKHEIETKGQFCKGIRLLKDEHEERDGERMKEWPKTGAERLEDFLGRLDKSWRNSRS